MKIKHLFYFILQPLMILMSTTIKDIFIECLIHGAYRVILKISFIIKRMLKRYNK